MTDKNDDLPERTDPVLVRPYVKAAGDAPDATEETWPEPEATVDDTLVLPAVAPPATAPGRRRGMSRSQILRLVVVLGSMGLAAAIVSYLILAPGERVRLDGPRTDLPVPVGPVVSDPPSVQPSASARRSPSASTSASASPSAGRSTPPSTAPSSAETLAPPPAADRTGPITSAGGRCLALGGLLGIDGSPVQTAGCADLVSQRFTLATDGTLRVAGRCAQTTGDGTVRSVGCDDRASAQWRAGPGGSLVNPATGHCLADPGRAGAASRTAACTGADDQRWTLP
jgi:hypothetical protein